MAGISFPAFSRATDSTYAESYPERVPLIKPPLLHPGDVIGIVAPAGSIESMEQVNFFQQILLEMGWIPKPGRHLLKRRGYFAGTDQERLEDLESMFADPEVKAIFCMRGGWGSARLLDKLNFNLIRQHPKVLMGFSDITSLLLGIHSQTGLVTFHGPMGMLEWDTYTRKSVGDMMLRNCSNPVRLPKEEMRFFRCIRPGRAEGRLIAGNLTVFCALVGTRYLPDMRGAILVLEDINEEPYRIDRMFNQLKLAGVLEQVAGIVFSQCTYCDPEEPERTLSLHQVLDDHLAGLRIPSFQGTMMGHIPSQAVFPIGILAEIHARKGIIRPKEPAMSMF